MSISDCCAEDSMSQTFGLSADSPISIASSPASSISSCDTFSDQGTEQLEANAGMATKTSDTTPNSSTSHVVGDAMTFASADNEERIRALMAKYEQVMNGDPVQTTHVSSDITATQGYDEAIVPNSHYDDQSLDKPTETDSTCEKPTPRRTRHVEKDRSRTRSRVQKKSATVSRRQAYTFERLGGARRATSGNVEYQVYWEPSWLPIQHLEGNDAVDEAKELVVGLFGSDTWHEEVRSLGLTL